MFIMNSPGDHCHICFRELDQLEPFEGVSELIVVYGNCIFPLISPDAKLIAIERDKEFYSEISWECKDCAGFPINPLEISEASRDILANHDEGKRNIHRYIRKTLNSYIDRFGLYEQFPKNP